MITKTCAVKKTSGIVWLANRSPHLPKYLMLVTLFYMAGPLQSTTIKDPVFPAKTVVVKTVADEQWKLAKTIDKVDFYYIIKACKGERTVFLKLDNKNNYAVKVSWKEIFQTQQKSNVEGVSGKKEIALAAGQTVQADCDNAAADECVIPPSKVSPAFKADVTKYDVTDVSITKN